MSQSQHNVNPQLFEFDPPLTDLGQSQVSSFESRNLFRSSFAELTKFLKVKATLHVSIELKPDLVLISPLRRTLQTAVGMFPNVQKVSSRQQ
jgi:hypothetical protein